MKEVSPAEKTLQNCVRRCRVVARSALVIVTIFWITFGLITGSQGEGGIRELVQNYANILPWIVILLLWFVAWRWEVPGGLLIIVFSVFMAFHLNVFEGNSSEGLMIITPLAMTGFMFVFIGFRIWSVKKLIASEREKN